MKFNSSIRGNKEYSRPGQFNNLKLLNMSSCLFVFCCLKNSMLFLLKCPFSKALILRNYTGSRQRNQYFQLFVVMLIHVMLIPQQNAGRFTQGIVEIVLLFIVSISKYTKYMIHFLIIQVKLLPQGASPVCLQVCLSARLNLRTLILLLILPLLELVFQVRPYF